MRTIEADVIIVGGGASGLAAAISAAEKGAAVAIFEKMNTTGGCGNMASGPLGVESTLQKKHIISLTKEEAVQKFMNYTHWRCDERLVREYIYRSGKTIDWLQSLGVRFLAPLHYFPGSDETWHFIVSKEGQVGRRTGAFMIQAMTDRAKELEVEIYLETPVKKIIKENGIVVGIVAEDKDGEIEARGGAVIVSTGGFGDNPDMIYKATGLKWGEEIYSIRVPGLNGEGINMAWEAGAAPSKMDMEMIYFAPNTPGYENIEIPFRQCDLLVNDYGVRFMNEAQMQNPVFTVNSIKQQPKCEVWSITNDAMIDHYIKDGLNFCLISGAQYDMSLYREELEKWLIERPDVVVRADTLDELAQKTGIDAEPLKKTVEEYNQACITGDEMFQKEKRFLSPIDGSRYYALKFAPSAYGSLGGIRINYKTEVLDSELKPIPGLYASGTDANSLYDPDYVFMLPGNTLGFALNSGLIAGENAVGYIQNSLMEQ